MIRRPHRPPLWRRFAWLLLPMLLALAQQGQARHEYSQHFAAGESQRKAPDGDRCASCLAFALVASVASHAVVAPLLRLDLDFHHGAESDVVAVDARRLEARSRGPPVFRTS